MKTTRVKSVTFISRKTIDLYNDRAEIFVTFEGDYSRI